jgi:hypothetical protein
MDRPSQHKSHLAGSLSFSQPGGPPCWVISLAFGLIGTTLPKPPLAWVETVLVILAHTQRQREGTGLLEYQAMPYLHDVAHDGWLCTFTIKQQLEIPSARSCAAHFRATGRVRKRQAVRPVRQQHPTYLYLYRDLSILF